MKKLMAIWLWLGLFVVFGCGGEGNTVPTYSISGAVIGTSGATVSLTGASIASVTTDGSGNYNFPNLPSGSYTLTPSQTGYTFTPSSMAVPVNGASVDAISFTATADIPMLTSGKLIYPCPQAMCQWDIATSTYTVLWGEYNKYPDAIVPSRDGAKIAFQGSNLAGIHLYDVQSGTQQSVIYGDWDTNCPSWAQESFDITHSGDVAVISGRCFPVGQPDKRDIAVIKTDGTRLWSRVTDDTAFEYSPVFGSAGGANDILTVIFASKKSDGSIGVYKQVIDPVNGTLVGGQELIASDVTDVNSLGVRRYVSVSADYNTMVFAKNVGGASHIVVKPVAGGNEVDLGSGYSPYCTADGRITYTNGSLLWIVNQDGTGKAQVPIPSNLSPQPFYQSMETIVFVP